MRNIWKYITLFFAGIIAGLVAAMKLQQPQTQITNHTEIGKVKNKGEGTTQHVTQAPDQSTGAPETRKAKRQSRRAARKRERKSKQATDEEV